MGEGHRMVRRRVAAKMATGSALKTNYSYRLVLLKQNVRVLYIGMQSKPDRFESVKFAMHVMSGSSRAEGGLNGDLNCSQTERERTGMSPLVYLEILAASKDFAASGERARKRFLAGMHSNVIDQLVLGLERLSMATTVEPEARVI
jgi:hypothetical protein